MYTYMCIFMSLKFTVNNSISHDYRKINKQIVNICINKISLAPILPVV